MKIGIRSKTLSAAGAFLAAYGLLLGLLQWSSQTRERCVSMLFMDNRYYATLQAVERDSKKYLNAQGGLGPRERAKLEGAISARLKGLWALSRELPGDKRGVNLLWMGFRQARRSLENRNNRLAADLYASATAKALMAKLKAGGDLAQLSAEEHRRLMMESIEETGTMISRIIWALAAMTAVLMLAATWWFANYISRNIVRLQEAFREIASGRRPQLPVEAPDELGALAEAFNEMAKLLKESQARWVKSEKLAAVEQLALGTAHAINNPLSAILGYTDLLMSAKLGDDVKADLKLIREQAERCSRVVRSLVSVSRGKEPSARKVQVNDLIKGMLGLLEGELQREKIELVAELEEGLPEVPGDAEKLEQAFWDILGQARKALHKRLRPELRIISQRHNGGLRVSFANNGDGARSWLGLLDPFFAALGAANGEGLELGEAYGAIRAQGGEVTVRRQAEGTVVLVELPLGA